MIKKIFIISISVIAICFSVFLIPISCASCKTVYAQEKNEIVLTSSFVNGSSADIQPLSQNDLILDLGTMLFSNSTNALYSSVTSLKLHLLKNEETNGYNLIFYVPIRRAVTNVFESAVYGISLDNYRENVWDARGDINVNDVYFSSSTNNNETVAGLTRNFNFLFTFTRGINYSDYSINSDPYDILKSTKTVCAFYYYNSNNDNISIIYRGYDTLTIPTTSEEKLNTIWELDCLFTGSEAVPQLKGNTRYFRPVLGFYNNLSDTDEYNRGYNDGVNSREPIETIVNYVNAFFDIKPFGGSFKLGHLIGIAVTITIMFFGLKIIRT